MKKRTTNRYSISISADLYAKLKAFAEENDCSLSGVTETVLRKDLGMPENERIDVTMRKKVLARFEELNMPDPLFPGL